MRSFDAEMGKLALVPDSGGNALKSATVPLSMKMSSYAAFASVPPGSLGNGNGDERAEQRYAAAVATGEMSEEERAKRCRRRRPCSASPHSWSACRRCSSGSTACRGGAERGAARADFGATHADARARSSSTIRWPSCSGRTRRSSNASPT